MKKPLVGALSIVAGVVAGILIAGVIFATTGFSIFGKIRENPTSSAEVRNNELTALAYNILSDLEDGDFQALSLAAHPEYGVVFSPYATITLSKSKCFQSEQIALFGSDTNAYVWGVYAGSGEPIEMTVADYLAQFVLYRDYSASAILGVNRIVRKGNALENITDVFPNLQFVDFHIPGNADNDGEDCAWSSLRLGFEEYDGSLWLTVILSSRWTD